MDLFVANHTQVPLKYGSNQEINDVTHTLSEIAANP